MVKWIRLVTLLAVLVFLTSPLKADDNAYLTVQNWTNEEVEVYIDGTDTGKVWKGYKECFSVTPGYHKVESYKASDRWKASSHWANPTCQYPDSVWVCDYDF